MDSGIINYNLTTNLLLNLTVYAMVLIVGINFVALFELFQLIQYSPFYKVRIQYHLDYNSPNETVAKFYIIKQNLIVRYLKFLLILPRMAYAMGLGLGNVNRLATPVRSGYSIVHSRLLPLLAHGHLCTGIPLNK